MFGGVWRCSFCYFSGQILDMGGGVEVAEKKSFSTRKRGHYCTLHIIVQYPPPSPPFVGGWVPRVLFPPLWCFPPRCLGAVPPPVFRQCYLYDPVATP